jgi:electron transfer flavoprotein alpha subunit
MVLVYSNDKRLMLELLAKAKDISEEVTAVVIGEENQPKDYIAHGADRVLVVQTDMEFKVEEYSEILKEVVKESGCDIVLIGSNKNGKELAPRLAAKLEAGCVTDCTDLSINEGMLTIERMVYSGNAVAVERFTSKPCIVTIPPRVFDPLPKDEKREGEIVKKEINVKKYPSKIVKIQEMKSGEVNVEDAEVIVSCGRGFKKKDDIKLVEELAKILGGTTGCSRPIAADLKWLSEDHWIGLSGHKVKPKLYIACGISGQIQHIAGMRDSDIVVAINKDPDALIFKSADYGIVGDLYEVLPKLTNAVRERMG